MYEKQGFYSGEKLKASQLDAMEDGIINAERLAMESAASAANMEKGVGEGSAQQIGDPSRVTEGKWSFMNKGQPRNPNAAADKTLFINGVSPFIGDQDYGAIGIYSGVFGGSNRASGPRSFAINNRTIAAGDESFSQGYCSVAAGPSAFAGGSTTYARGEAAVSLGVNTQALADYSCALGNNTIVEAPTEEEKAAGILKGQIGFATGTDTRVSGYAASAHGSHTIANQTAQCVVGQYNDINFTKEGFHSLFQIGCGSNEGSRLNGFNISEGGEIIIHWNGAYYSLQNIFNLLANQLGYDFFDAAKV